MPWATASGNLDHVLRLARIPRRERGERIAETAAQVALEPDDLAEYPV